MFNSFVIGRKQIGNFLAVNQRGTDGRMQLGRPGGASSFVGQKLGKSWRWLCPFQTIQWKPIFGQKPITWQVNQ